MRHERIVLVILSYIIGFTTAFIGYGIPSSSNSADEVSKDSFAASALGAAKSKNTTLMENEKALYAVVDGKQKVVSGKLVDGITPGRGFHTAVPFRGVSPSGQYVYFCEQETEEQTECKEYIYDVDKHMVYRLNYESRKISASLSHTDFKWQEVNDIAEYADLVSISPAEPWKLVAR